MLEVGWGGLGSKGSSFPFGSFQAASFGKCFLDRFPPDTFVHMCQDLRVLNAIRDYHIGIPLTYTQYPYVRHEGIATGHSRERAGDVVCRSLANRAYTN